MLLLATVLSADVVAQAQAFARAAGIPPSKTAPKVDVGYAGSSTVQLGGGIYVQVDAKGHVFRAMQAAPPSRRSIRQLSEKVLREKVDAWVKRWPAPPEFTKVRFFVNRNRATILFDRKIGDYDLEAPWAYSVHAGTGEFSSFVAPTLGTITSNLSISKKAAQETAAAAMKEIIARRGSHNFSSRIGYIATDAEGNRTLGYTFHFLPRKAINFYGGTRVMVDGGTGKVIGKPIELAYKGG